MGWLAVKVEEGGAISVASCWKCLLEISTVIAIMCHLL